MHTSLFRLTHGQFRKAACALMAGMLFFAIGGCASFDGIISAANQPSSAATASEESTDNAAGQEAREATDTAAAQPEETSSSVPSSVKQLPLNREYTFGDKDAPRTILLNEWSKEGSEEVLLTIETEGSKAIADVGYTEFHPYLVTLSSDYEYNTTDEARYYLYLDAAGELGQRALFVYDLNGASLTEATQLPLGLNAKSAASLTPESFKLENRCAFLSAYTITKRYHVGQDGVPESKEEDFAFDVPANTILVSKKEMPAGEVFRSRYGVSTKERLLAEGRELRFYATDNATYLDLQDVKDLKVYRFSIDSTKYPPQIGEEGITSLFDGVVLTGQE